MIPVNTKTLIKMVLAGAEGNIPIIGMTVNIVEKRKKRNIVETVKRIFELYLDGNGVRRIQDIMEQEGRKTAHDSTGGNKKSLM